jgi:hypothetical protein
VTVVSHRHGRRDGAGEPDAAPLPGVLSFRPRLPAILLLLTLTVAVAGYRITRDGSGKAVERIAREALSAYGEWGPEGDGKGSWSGGSPAAVLGSSFGSAVPLPLPGGGGNLEYLGARKRPFGKDAAAAVRFTVAGGRYLLLVVREGGRSRPASPDTFFSGAPLLSGVRGGLSFVFWRSGGLAWCLVSDRDQTETFDVARDRFLGVPAP